MTYDDGYSSDDPDDPGGNARPVPDFCPSCKGRDYPHTVQPVLLCECHGTCGQCCRSARCPK